MIRIVAAALAVVFLSPAVMSGERDNYYYPPVSYREHDILVVTGEGAENITGFPYGPEHNIIGA